MGTRISEGSPKGVTVSAELVELNAGGPESAVFCVHAENFRHVAAFLRTDRAMYGLRPINLEQADLRFSIEDLAQIYVNAVTALQTEGPYRLLGYSIGGLIAYEMARLLEARGEEIALLALFDAPHPEFRQHLSPEELATVRRTYLDDRKEKYLKNLRAGRVDRLVLDAGSLVAKRLRPIVWRIGLVLRRLLKLRPLAVSEAVRSDAMWHAYSPQPFAGRVVLFRAEGREAEFADDATMGWRRSASGGVDVQFAQGIHEEMMELPHARHLADRLTPYLEPADGCDAG
jgi:thioesterase domain-containing protein